jgi:ABC-type amino acid transport substrate-binding protein
MSTPRLVPGRQGKISPSDFFDVDKEKTKINWFCFEYAAEIEGHISKSLKKNLGRAGVGEGDIAGFCIDFSKTMKIEILRWLAGDIAAIQVSHHDIKGFFPALSDKLVDGLLSASQSAWDDLLQTCAVCPVRCITEKDARAEMFDDHDYYE